MLSPSFTTSCWNWNQGQGYILKAVSGPTMQKLKGAVVVGPSQPLVSRWRISPERFDDPELWQTEWIGTRPHFSLLLEELPSHGRKSQGESQAGDNGLQGFKSFSKGSHHPLRLATLFTFVTTELFCLSEGESDHFLIST